MKIGIDLSPLQNAHRMRGIGYTLINFINNISTEDRKNNQFVFYVLPSAEALFKDPFELINLGGVEYEIREIPKRTRIPRFLPGRLNMVIGLANRVLVFSDFYTNKSRIRDISGLDVFLQADQNELLPKSWKLKRYVIVYDLIPYILERDYWWKYKTARINGCSRLASIKHAVQRYLKIRKLIVNSKRAKTLLAISEKTKNDFNRYLKVPKKKIKVSLLGVSITDSSAVNKISKHRYVDTSWGYVKRRLNVDLENEKFVLYVGGADKRRKLEDMITAFNHLRAEGYSLKLVLAGDIMLGPKAITNDTVADALSSSSYIDDIIFMGFVDDSTKDWLYKNALAYIFPSRYEGFGLPIIEAMALQCPVISYRNEAVEEVAGHSPQYAADEYGIYKAIKKMYDGEQHIQLSSQDNSTIVAKYSWRNTSKSILREITK